MIISTIEKGGETAYFAFDILSRMPLMNDEDSIVEYFFAISSASFMTTE